MSHRQPACRDPVPCHCSLVTLSRKGPKGAREKESSPTGPLTRTRPHIPGKSFPLVRKALLPVAREPGRLREFI